MAVRDPMARGVMVFAPASGGAAAMGSQPDPDGRRLADVPGVRGGIRAKLARAGIRTLDDLAELEHDADRRRDIARETGLSRAAALRFAGLAGILRLEGMSDEHARVLIEAGVDSYEKLRGESRERLLLLLSPVEPHAEDALESWIGPDPPARR